MYIWKQMTPISSVMKGGLEIFKGQQVTSVLNQAEMQFSEKYYNYVQFSLINDSWGKGIYII